MTLNLVHFLKTRLSTSAKWKSWNLCVDPRLLNSVTKLVSIPFAIEPIQNLLTRITAKIFPISDSSNAYHQVLLAKKKCNAFFTGNKQNTYRRCCYGLSGLPNVFSWLLVLSMTSIFKTIQSLTYFDDTILQAQNKDEVFEVIPDCHSLVRTAGLKVSLDQKFFFLQNVIFLGHIISDKGIQPIAKMSTV